MSFYIPRRNSNFVVRDFTVNHQQNHTENHYEFSQRKSEIFTEKIKILIEEIKISMDKIQIFIEEIIERLPKSLPAGF